MLETMLSKRSLWLSAEGPEAELVVKSRGVLVRNLSDFAFSWRCSESERRTVEERIVAALEQSRLMPNGRYVPLSQIDGHEVRFLLERNLVPRDFPPQVGSGVYISDDQSLAVLVNGVNHLRLQVMLPGLQLQEAWARLTIADDILSEVLDFAFDETLGFLSADLGSVGTGLRLSATLHLPALTFSNAIRGLAEGLRDEWHVLEPVFGEMGAAHGELYALAGAYCLGRSEDEIVFHVKHLAADLITKEKAAREAAMAENPRAVEDRVGRAVGIAQGARLLDLSEALEVWSSLRMGRAMGLLSEPSLMVFNELLPGLQRAHLELQKGHSRDEMSLSADRADLFRASFGTAASRGNGQE